MEDGDGRAGRASGGGRWGGNLWSPGSYKLNYDSLSLSLSP